MTLLAVRAPLILFAVLAAAAPQDKATREMAERLARLDKEYAESRLFVNPHRLALLRARRKPDDPFEARLAFAQELLNAGETREAVDELSSLLKTAPAGREVETRSWLGIAELRLGEQQNCVMHHNASSCLMPIRGGGVHALKEGALAAMEHFGRVLDAAPGDVAARWLLNVAAMAAGKYPEGLAEGRLIPPEAFKPAAKFPRFPDKAHEAGLDFIGHAGGAITEDFDGRGWLDVVVSGQGLQDQLRYFRNNGDGTFTERTKEAGLAGITGGLNLIEGDFDNDGRPDIIVLRGAWQMKGGEEPLSLLRANGDGTFSDVTEKAGLLGLFQTQAAALADLDGDGWLDLALCEESFPGRQRPCTLFHNNRDGTFGEVGAKSGFDAFGLVKSVAVGDFDGDGRPDIYVGRWGQGNVLYHQNADGTFSDVTKKAGVAEPKNTFPSWFFDYDGDGRLDLLAFGFVEPDSSKGLTAIGYAALKDVAADYLRLPFKQGKPRLYRNKGAGVFEDVTDAAGLDHVMFAMGSNFADLDDDGYPDFYAGTGVPDLRGLMPNRLFRNDGGKRFLDVTSAADMGHLQKGHAVAFGDLNNDGYPDAFVVLGGAYDGDVYQRSLFANPGFENAWLGLTLEGVKSNRSAVGARIKVVASGASGRRTLYAWVTTGGSFGASGLRQIVGLGDATKVESVEVSWPRRGGKVERFEGAAARAFWRLKEGAGRALPVETKTFAWKPS